MAQFSPLLISGDFAQGVTRYRDHYPGEAELARMVLPVTVEGRLIVHAVVDTGAPWCILAPEIIRQIGMTAQINYEADRRLLLRGIWYEGRLLRMRLGLQAENAGDDLEVEATVFVPTLALEEIWLHPNFIGLDGFLNRIRFAVDPTENAFYFGPL